MKFKTLYSALFLFLILPIHAQYIEQKSLITVCGNWTEQVMPDEIIISLATTDKITPQEANNFSLFWQNSMDVDIKFIGVSEQDYFKSIDQLFNNGSFYTFTREYIITIKNLSKYRDVLERLLKLNKGNFTILDFRYSQLEKLKNTARVKAIHNAKENAELMVAELGLTLGNAFTVIDKPMPIANWYNKADIEKIKSNADFDDIYIISPGYISISAEVCVSFE